MKIVYLKLQNVAGISVGQQKELIEIDMAKSQHRIISICGANSTGKTTLAASLTPFAASTAALEERSTLPYIIPGKNGYKEIHYQVDDNLFVLKHYFKPSGEQGHSVKSYFIKNGIELNENGNVTSFLSLVEIHLGLTTDMMRLIRLGSNVNSFISLRPADRKNYIGRLIEEVDLPLKIYRKTNDDLRVVKTLLNSNSLNLQACHISNPKDEKNNINKLKSILKNHYERKDELRLKLSQLDKLTNENNIIEIQARHDEAQLAITTLIENEKLLMSRNLKTTTIEKLKSSHVTATTEQINLKSKITSYRLMIDANSSKIEHLKATIKRSTLNSDIKALPELITTLEANINNTPKLIVKLEPKCSSEIITSLISKLRAMNQISSMIHSLGSKSLTLYLDLRANAQSIDQFVKKQRKQQLSTITKGKLQLLIDELFQSEFIISPNCYKDTFNQCPYYRLAKVINNNQYNKADINYDDEVLNYVTVIADNISSIISDTNQLNSLPIPDAFKEMMTEQNIIHRLKSGLAFFELNSIQEYLSRVRAWEIYNHKQQQLSQLKRELEIYQLSGADHQLVEIEQLQLANSNYLEEINLEETKLKAINTTIESIENDITLLTTIINSRKYHKLMKSTLASTSELLASLNKAYEEKIKIEQLLYSEQRLIDKATDDIQQLEHRLVDYYRLSSENTMLSDKFNKLTIIMESTSTNKGLPIVYMNAYLGKIQSIANKLLSIIYHDRLMLRKFKVTDDGFSIPFVRNGFTITDIRYASQSELPMITMALSFAIAYGSNKKYNILLLDEIDAGLDDNTRYLFLRMLEEQLRELNSEQAFIISHNLMNGMLNIPIDVIKMSDVQISNNIHNIIYE